MSIVPFNPLERKHLGASVAQEMLRQKPQPLVGLPRFAGAGVYAIYYVGDFEPYAALAAANRDDRFALPIYVGKAIPKGASKGGGSAKGTGASYSLSKRLREHGESVQQAENLDEDDFFCRYLVVEDIFIPLGESLLIAKFAPVWNAIVTGFGNHNPGKGRLKGARPRWDAVHPGRAWADRYEPQPVPAEAIAMEAENYLLSISIPTSQFVEEEPALSEPPPVDFSDDETEV